MANAQGGSYFPQDFALGILNLYTTLQNRKAQLQEMRADRSARNLLEEQRLQLDQGNQAFQQEMQKAQFASLQAERDAEMKYRYDVLRENRKAQAQDAATKFGAGLPTFFPMGIPLPAAPTVKNKEGKEIPAFEFSSYEMPGLGTFVVPKNRLTDQLGLEDKYLDRQKTQIQMIDSLMEADQRQAHADYWRQQVEQTKNWPYDRDSVIQARLLDQNMAARLANFERNDWRPIDDAERKDKFGTTDLKKAFETHVGEKRYNLWLKTQAYLTSHIEQLNSRAAAPPHPVGAAAISDHIDFRGWSGEVWKHLQESLSSAQDQPTARTPSMTIERPANPANWPNFSKLMEPLKSMSRGRAQEVYHERAYLDPTTGKEIGVELIHGQNEIVGFTGKIPGKEPEPSAGPNATVPSLKVNGTTSQASPSTPGAPPAPPNTPGLGPTAFPGLTPTENARANFLLQKSRIQGQLTPQENQEAQLLHLKIQAAESANENTLDPFSGDDLIGPP